MRISIIVKTRAKENKVKAMSDELKVFVKEPAREGKANKAVIELLAEHFQVPKSEIEIISGYKSKNKIISINE
jgi:hypothetical protein